jgi:hypothetical protein
LVVLEYGAGQELVEDLRLPAAERHWNLLAMSGWMDDNSAFVREAAC